MHITNTYLHARTLVLQISNLESTLILQLDGYSFTCIMTFSNLILKLNGQLQLGARNMLGHYCFSRHLWISMTIRKAIVSLLTIIVIDF